MDARGIVKISDFGVSHFFEEEQDIGAHRLAEARKHHPTQLTRLDTDSALQMEGMADTGLLTKTEGTWCFWSPEMCSSTAAFSGYAADLWAAGVCLYIFVTGKLPFFSEIPTELFDMIAAANVNYSGLGLSNSLVDLLKATLEKDPAKRAGVGDCLKHPFLQVARTKRIQQLSEEFRQSKKRGTLVVEDDDIRRVRSTGIIIRESCGWRIQYLTVCSSCCFFFCRHSALLQTWSILQPFSRVLKSS